MVGGPEPMSSSIRRLDSGHSQPRAWLLAGAAIAYLLLALLWTAPMSLDPTTAIADLGDPTHLSYVLAWDAHQLVRRPLALFDSNSFYPYPGSLAFGEHLLPEALLVAPVFWLTGNAVLTYNTCVLLGLILSALGMATLIFQLTRSPAAAFLSGLAYSFTGFSLMEIARVQVVHLQWWPLALLFLIRFVETSRFRDALAFGVLLMIQGLSCSYYLVYSALAAPLWLGVVFAVRGRAPSRRELSSLAGAALLAAIPLLLVIWPYLGRITETGDGTVSNGVDLFALLTPGHANPLWGTGGSTSYAREYLGHVTSLLALAGLFLGLRRAAGPRLRAIALLAALTLLMGIVMTLGPTASVGGRELGRGPLYYLIEALPLTGLRHSPRFAVLTKLGAAILVGLAVAEGGRRLPRLAKPPAFLVLALLLPLEHWQPSLYGAGLPSGSRVPEVYPWLSARGSGPLVELPLFAKKRFWAVYMYFSTYHWRPIPLGRTSFYPASHELLATTLSRFPDEASLESLDRLGIRTIVVHPQLWDDAERPSWLEALAGEPRLELQRRFTSADPLAPWLSESLVFELRESGGARSQPCRLMDERSRLAWRSSSNVRGANSVLDGDLATTWSTGREQAAGDWLRIVFPEGIDLAAIALYSGRDVAEFPRNPLLELRDDTGRWTSPALLGQGIERWRTLEALMTNPREAPFVFRFAQQRATALRITLASEGQFTAPWTVAELRAFGGCR